MRLVSGPQYRRKLLSLVFMWTPMCYSLNAKRFIHMSVRLNKSVRGHMALWGYCLGPCTGESCCRWCFLCTPRCNSLNAKRFIHVSLRLNKSVMGYMDLGGYCLGPSTGESCCRWCFCVLQHVIVLMPKDSSMYLFGWITPYECGPLGLTSGAKYRKKLLSLLFSI